MFGLGEIPSDSALENVRFREKWVFLARRLKQQILIRSGCWRIRFKTSDFRLASGGLPTLP